MQCVPLRRLLRGDGVTLTRGLGGATTVVGGPTGTLGRATVLVAVVAATAVCDLAAAAVEVAPGLALVFPAEALVELDRESGAQFDSGVVEFLEQAVAEGGRGGGLAPSLGVG